MKKQTILGECHKFLKASQADIRKGCVSACPQKTPTLRGDFRKRRLTDTPRRHHLADDLTLRTPKFQLVWRRLCDDVLFRSSCLFERTLYTTR